MSGEGVDRITWTLVVLAMGDGRWHTTAEIADLAEIEHRPGTQDLRPLREMLYSLQLHGWVEQEPRHNGHRWRLMEDALPDGVSHA